MVMANELLKLLVGDHSKQSILDMLQALSEALITHCDNEEGHIAALHPQRLQRHVVSHEQMLGRMKFLTDLYENDDLPLNALIQFIVFEICIQHIAQEDHQVFSGEAPVRAADRTAGGVLDTPVPDAPREPVSQSS
jgi:hemerythrin